MAQIYNSDVIKRILDDAKIQTSRDNVPTKLAEKVVPVLIANPKHYPNIVFDNSGTNADRTLFTTSSGNKDFYLTHAVLSVAKDATSDNTNSFFRVIINGVNSDILTIAGITLTAQQSTLNASFNPPLKLDRNSDVRLILTTASVGTNTLNGSVIGYYVED